MKDPKRHQHRSRSSERLVRTFMPVQIMALIAAAACRPADDSYDVILYVVDACRADRIGYYGYERPTTPTIDALAADPDAVVYRRHYVAGNWTKPATASLFTSTFEHQHGVTNQMVETEEGRYRSEALVDEFVTLAESLKEAGYSTLGLVTSYHLSPSYGFDQGFDRYYDPESLKVGDAGRIAKLLELVEDVDQPYFAYVHQNACHNPFPPQDRDAELMDRFAFDYDEASRIGVGVDFTTNDSKEAIVNGKIELTEEDARFLSLIYDAKLRTADREVVRPMIEGLRRAGRWDRTLFILTADHGEELYEHRGYAHGGSLWEEVIRVPLIVKFPKGLRPQSLAKNVDVLTSNVDLYPSLMALLGRPPATELMGRPIFDAPGEGFIVSGGLPRNTPSQSPTGWAVIEGWEKLIVDNGGERKRLFDLRADPGETEDLAAAMPGRVRELEALAKVVAGGKTIASAQEIETELSPEAVETLRSLGYLN